MIEKGLKDKQLLKQIWNSEILALLQGDTICLVSLVKNSEWSNKNWRRSSDLKQKLTDDDGKISNTISWPLGQGS